MNLILIVAAVLPAWFLLRAVYRADRLEKEPMKLLLSLVVLGIISTTLAATAEQLGSYVLSRLLPEDSLLAQAMMYFGIVAFSEEGFKYLLLKNRTWRSPHFNCQFDAVVYAVFVSLGFALWENIGYVMAYGLGAAGARALTAVPGHACFGVFMGTWYGIAKRCDLSGFEEESARARRSALLIPALLHGLYDFIASMQVEYLGLVFVVFVAGLFIVSLRLVRRISRNDRYMQVNRRELE